MAEPASVREWLDAQPPMPEPVRAALAALFAGSDLGDGALDELLDKAGPQLEAAMRAAGAVDGSLAARGAHGLRPGAAELLLADALITYAALAASESDVPATRMLERVRRMVEPQLPEPT